MFMVFWLEDCVNPYARDFQMSEALQFMESLRKAPAVSFIVMASENPNSVGKPGAEYSWCGHGDAQVMYSGQDDK
jgi:hypothetical protein